MTAEPITAAALLARKYTASKHLLCQRSPSPQNECITLERSAIGAQTVYTQSFHACSTISQAGGRTTRSPRSGGLTYAHGTHVT